jgi:hypothetical protein
VDLQHMTKQHYFKVNNNLPSSKPVNRSGQI